MYKGGWVYILTNKRHTVLYTGITANLPARIREHITRQYPASFTARYNVDKLVYYKLYDTIEEAMNIETSKVCFITSLEAHNSLRTVPLL